MLFMITQVHSPEACPREEGGAKILFDRNADGVTLKGRWGGLVAPYHLVLGGGRRPGRHPTIRGSRDETLHLHGGASE